MPVKRARPKQIPVRVDLATYERMERIGEREDRPVASVVRLLLREALERREPPAGI